MRSVSLLLVVITSFTSFAVAPTNAAEQVIKIVAKRYEYNPKEIILEKDKPVTLELTSEDRLHGFNIPDLHVRAAVPKGKTTIVQITPKKAGKYDFYCDVFCGSGHEDMNGTITVK